MLSNRLSLGSWILIELKQYVQYINDYGCRNMYVREMILFILLCVKCRILIESRYKVCLNMRCEIEDIGYKEQIVFAVTYTIDVRTHHGRTDGQTNRLPGRRTDRQTHG